MDRRSKNDLVDNLVALGIMLPIGMVAGYFAPDVSNFLVDGWNELTDWANNFKRTLNAYDALFAVNSRRY
jgi:hypothetical protein